MELRLGCNGASPQLQMERIRDHWSSAAAAMELRLGCNGASPQLQWSAARAVMERRRGCNEASPETSSCGVDAFLCLVWPWPWLQWSSTLVLPERAPTMQWSAAGDAAIGGGS
ncbi:hypothetical protein CFC21_031522 [Triticum aestivum]|uniref:Uncharacterized protein n=2 Tax=Triticum aestivum TaxID=4565 RepID=A0A3B6DI73_WHEAT|nr:hypothetical protein CFC21_031522 [Triticum aestivum]